MNSQYISLCTETDVPKPMKIYSIFLVFVEDVHVSRFYFQLNSTRKKKSDSLPCQNGTYDD